MIRQAGRWTHDGSNSVGYNIDAWLALGPGPAVTMFRDRWPPPNPTPAPFSSAFVFFEYEYAGLMSSTLRERTLLPPEDPADLALFARNLVAADAPGRARLVGPDGSEIEIPKSLYGVLLDVVSALSQGLAISIAPHNPMLTTQEAADLLNISRPTLVRLLTEGEISHTLRGRHRRVLLRDILEYSERTRSERRDALDQMAADAEDDGLYEATATTRPTR